MAPFSVAICFDFFPFIIIDLHKRPPRELAMRQPAPLLHVTLDGALNDYTESWTLLCRSSTVRWPTSPLYETDRRRRGASVPRRFYSGFCSIQSPVTVRNCSDVRTYVTGSVRGPCTLGGGHAQAPAYSKANLGQHILRSMETTRYW